MRGDGMGLRGGLTNVAGAVISSAGVPQGAGGAQESATVQLGKTRIATAKRHQNAESTGRGYSTTHARLLMFMCDEYPDVVHTDVLSWYKAVSFSKRTDEMVKSSLDFCVKQCKE